MIVTRPVGNESDDLLTGHEQSDLLLYDLNDQFMIRKSPPCGGWTHEELEAFDCYQHSPQGWNAYLGTTANWIGSSEV